MLRELGAIPPRPRVPVRRGAYLSIRDNFTSHVSGRRARITIDMDYIMRRRLQLLTGHVNLSMAAHSRLPAPTWRRVMWWYQRRLHVSAIILLNVEEYMWFEACGTEVDYTFCANE